jgi:hypothetical protein
MPFKAWIYMTFFVGKTDTAKPLPLPLSARLTLPENILVIGLKVLILRGNKMLWIIIF